MGKTLKVLVVDDSAFMRKIISNMINSDPQLTVVGTAFDGLNALKKIPQLDPDVITLDVNMPRMDGLTTLKKIMKQHPKPVIMVSATTQEGAEITFKALKLGAVDYITKPSGQISLDIEKVRSELVNKIKTAAQANLVSHEHVTCSPVKINQEASLKSTLLIFFFSNTWLFCGKGCKKATPSPFLSGSMPQGK